MLDRLILHSRSYCDAGKKVLFSNLRYFFYMAYIFMVIHEDWVEHATRIMLELEELAKLVCGSINSQN